MEEIIKIDLERSEYITNRENLRKLQQVPTLSQAKSSLGNTLANLVFKRCEEALKQSFGLKPVLKGPGEELWVAPSDLLIGKVCLKPPLTCKYIQALTHKGILDIGSKIEMKYWNEMLIEKENALELQRRLLQENFEDELKYFLKELELKERCLCMKKIKTLTEEFEITLVEELYALEKKLLKQARKKRRETRRRLKAKCQAQINKEIDATVKTMTLELFEALKKQEEQLQQQFTTEIQKAQLQKDFEIQMERICGQEALKQLRHSLECKNIANMMYILCIERRKCVAEKNLIEETYKEKIKKLQETLDHETEMINQITEKRNDKAEEVNLREMCLLKIIREFQKFINFALKASPTQAEFLLSVEKLMVFELAESLYKTDYKKIKTPEEILPWAYNADKGPVPSAQSLQIKDFHNCFNEQDPPEGADNTKKPSDFLPAFNYKKNLYVREDFRNMMSQGLEIRPSNVVWNKDVEILMQTLKESVTVGESSNKVVQERTSRQGSTVKFQRKNFDKVERDNRSLYSNKSLLKTNHNSLAEFINFHGIGLYEQKRTILGSRNSLDLIRTKIRPIYINESPTPSNYAKLDEPNAEQVAEGFYVMKKKPSLYPDIPERESVVDKEFSELSNLSYYNEGRKLSKPTLTHLRESMLAKRHSIIKRSTERDSDLIQNLPEDLPENIPRRTKTSLVLAKDSVEVIRRQSRIAETKRISMAFPGASPKCSVLCGNSCLKRKTNSTIPSETIEKITISPKIIQLSNIKMESKEILRQDYDTTVQADSLEKLYRGTSTKSSVKSKKPKVKVMKNKLKIVGDQKATEGYQQIDEFTVDRIHSFVHLMREHPNLIRTFTACTR